MISDPDREPILERAIPADAVPGSTRTPKPRYSCKTAPGCGARSSVSTATGTGGGAWGSAAQTHH